MSNMTEAHNIVPYTSGITKPLNGQRLATVTYKTDKLTGTKPASVACSIPQVDTEAMKAHIDEFIPHIKTLVERTQDAIIRERHEASATLVSDKDIDIEHVIEYLNAESTGGRLTKAQVVEWFDENIADPLAVALATKMGVSENPTEEQSNRIENLLKEFRNNIGALTAGNMKYDPDTCNVLQKAISFAPADDILKERFNQRLDTMKKQIPKSLLDAL
jgi:hypothetical protein